MTPAYTPLARALRNAIGVGIAASIVAVPAIAQQQPQKAEKIEVTGSNIKRVDAEGVAPVQVISREEIDKSGKSTVAELLRSISANTGNSFSETFTNSFSPGASGIALRGLTQKNTLVLLNGRRLANYGFAQNLQDTYVDLNSLPASAVERIEVLKDGASAVYGSDAIAGVVNVILTKDFRGVQVDGSFGVSSEGDGEEYKLGLAGGMGDLAKDKYNVLATFNYMKRELVKFSDRNFTKDYDFRRFQGGTFDWSAAAGTYRQGVNRVPFPGCLGVGTVIPANQFANSGALTGSSCGYNPAPYLTLFPEAERYQFLVRGTAEFSNNLTGFAEVFFSDNKSFQIFTPAGLGATSVAFNPATGGVARVSNVLPIGNPSNPFNAATQIQTTFFDVGSRDSDIESKAGRFLAGLKGTAGSFDWEVAAAHAESKDEQVNLNRVDRFVLTQVIQNGSYNFINPAATPDVTNRLRINPTRSSTSKIDYVDGKITTDLAQLPAGPLGFAAGLDYRRESLKDRPDALLTGGNVLGQGATATDGSRNVSAAYVEFSVPAMKGLEFQIAGRGDRYSDFGSAFSPKVGARWQPTKELLFRTSYSKGFRAPSLPEISKSSATFFTNVVDPRDPQQPGRLVNISGVFSGNPDLEAEKSQNYNLGFVIEPTNDFNIGLDYYKIKQKNVVAPNGFQFIVDNEARFPDKVIRTPEGLLLTVLDQYRNIQTLDTSGIDLDFRKIFRLGGATKFTLGGTWTYLIEYKHPLAVGEPSINFVDSNEDANASGGSYPRYRGKLTFGLDSGPWSGTLTYNYIHSWDQKVVAVPPAQARVGAYSQFDLYMAYEGIKNLKLFASVQNLADKEPPFDPSFATNRYDFTQHDLRGRYYTVGAKYTFK